MSNKSEEKSLDFRQARVAEALAAGLSTAVVAKEAGVSDRTVRRYAKLPEVQAAIRRAETERLVTLSRKLTSAADAALGVLVKAMTDKDNSTSTKIRAALGILQYRREFYELTALQDQMDALESRLKEAGL